MPHAGTTARALEREFKPEFMLVRVRNGHFRVCRKDNLEAVRLPDGRPIDLPFSPRRDDTPQLRKQLILAGVIATDQGSTRSRQAGTPLDQEALRRAEAQRAEYEASFGPMPKVKVERGVISVKKEPELKEIPMEEFAAETGACGNDFWVRCALCDALVDVRLGDSHMRVVHKIVPS